jgi:hypothetical protein
LWRSLPDVVRVVGRLDRVELKVIVDDELEAALAVLGAEVDPPRIRRIHYLDTPDLALQRRGVIVRARITETSGRDGAAGDVVVKLRRPAPLAPPRSTGVVVELDALPVDVAYALSMKRRLPGAEIERGLARRRPARHLLGKKQRAMLRRLTGARIDLDELVVFGPVDAVRVTAGRVGDRLGVESWALPDGSRIVELFAKCSPVHAARTAARLRDLIDGHRIAVADCQDTKTRMTLERLVEVADRCGAPDQAGACTAIVCSHTSSRRSGRSITARSTQSTR